MLDEIGLELVIVRELHAAVVRRLAMQPLRLLRDVRQLVCEQRLTGGTPHRLLGRVAHEDHTGRADGHGVGVALPVELLGKLTGVNAHVSEVDAEALLVLLADAVLERIATTGAPRHDLQQARWIVFLGELVREILGGRLRCGGSVGSSFDTWLGTFYGLLVLAFPPIPAAGPGRHVTL